MAATSSSLPSGNGEKAGTTSEPTFKAVTIRPGLALLSILIVVAAGVMTLIQAPDPRPDERWSDKSIWDWLRYPMERYPGLRLPRAPDDLYATSFADDGLHGITVGAGGTILGTSDGGRTWTAQDSGVSNSLWDVQVDVDGKRAWAVGTKGAILTTVDGGQVWTIINSPRAVRLRAVHFAKGGQRVWIAGDNGVILVTDNGGDQWSVGSLAEDIDAKASAAELSKQLVQQRPPNAAAQRSRGSSPRDLASIHFTADGRRGWAVGAFGAIWTSSNGGQQWTPQSGPHKEDCLNAVRFATDGQRGWAVGCYGTVIRTLNGGAGWTGVENLDLGANGALALTSLDVSPDGKRVWLAREDGAIFNSTDEGKTWLRQRSGANGWLYKIRFSADGNKGWAVGTAGVILSSNDGGNNWITRTSSNASTLNAIHLDTSGRLGWAVGGQGIILSTTDAGSNWVAQTSGVDRPLNFVKFLADNRRGWAVGEGGTIISTIDGGRQWRIHDSGMNAYLAGVHFLDDGRRGWVVGANGLVLSTTNGGQDWQSQNIPDESLLTAIHFEPGGRRGWIAAYDGLHASTDGGQSWQKVPLGTTDISLIALQFDDQDRWGVAVGAAGTIFTTKDGGQSWTRKASGTNADLNATHIGKSGQAAWVAGSNGILLSTKDRGENWVRADTKVGSGLWGVGFADDGKTGWAVGYPPGLLKTDNGTSWEPIRWPLSSQRYPAPWFWIMLLPAGLLLLRSVRINVDRAEKGVEAIAATDAPISDFARDRLQFGPLARGISRFLRNTSTRPPLTVAISGDWGSGKSTLMELVCTDLRRYGVRPVWFNAWHHQQEEQLLAALLSAIRSKGLPPIGSADGPGFRLRLLWIRSKKHFVIALVALAAAAAFLSYLLTHGFADWTMLWADLTRLGESMSKEKPTGGPSGMTWTDAARLIPQLVAGLTALTALGKGLKAFKVDPAVLLRATAENFKLKDASAQTSFRSKFAEQFGEVTDALPYTMVIVIDDLDRCQPATVLIVMEAVNFLVSSGKCFVLFGMATHRVQAALGLAFKEVANELEELDVPAAEASATAAARLEHEQRVNQARDYLDVPASQESVAEATRRLERDRRLSYARDYLEKLINLEVIVPARTDIPPHRLVEASSDQRPDYIAAVITQVLEFWPSWVAGMVLLAGALIGVAYTPRGDATPPVNIARTSATEVVVKATTPLIVQDQGGTTPSEPLHKDPNRYLPAIQKDVPVAIDPWLVAIAAIVFIAFAGGFVLYRLRAASNAVKDSEDYASALRIWMPVIQQRRSTPRAIKRFANRLRYLAMLQQETKYDESGFDMLPRQVARSLQSLWKNSKNDGPSPVVAPRVPHAVREPLLVALASLHEVHGAQWREQLVGRSAGKFQSTIETAIAGYLQTPGSIWPPDGTNLDAFERLLNGVRIADDENQTATPS